MSIWRISGSLILSHNFDKNRKFSWPQSLAKFQILTNFSRLPFQTCEWIASLKMAFWSVLMSIWRISGSLSWVIILSKIENFHGRGPKRNFRFWPIFQDFDFRLVNELQLSKWHSGVFSCLFEGFLEVWGWVKILSKIENFHDCGH